MLFRRLDGLALERLAGRTLAQVSAELEHGAGLRLEVADPLVLSLFVLRFGAGGDARRLAAELRGFLLRTAGEVLHEGGGGLVGEALAGVGVFRFELPPGEPLPESVLAPFKGATRVLVIDDDPWEQGLGGGFECRQVVDQAGAARVLREWPADFALLDLHIGARAGEDRRDAGLSLLRWLRVRHPELPVYLFSEHPEARGVSAELLERVRLEGGARGVLPKRFTERGGDALERDGFFAKLREIDAGLRRQRLVEHFGRRAKVVDFDVVASPPRDGAVALALGRVREAVAVSAADRARPGWVDLPRDRFADVAGAEQAKLRLQEVVRWLADPEPLRALGLELPRGILLTGPPGTGKTTLARAVAGEAEAPFFAVSGSELFSKWVGESEANLRDLFARARRYAPSIVFIDEIDSLGRSRAGGREAWRDGVLNELLAQMDGFRQGDRPVFVLAATNRPDVLDPALLRPGRFDLQVEIPNPGPAAREAIFRLHLKGKPQADGLDLAALVGRTAGLSGAEIKQVCQEAGRIALRQGQARIAGAHLQEAITALRVGLATEGLTMAAEARWATAVHEAGHAVARQALLPDEPVAQVTILPRAGALGFVEAAEGREQRDETADRLRRRVQVLLAGRAAEELLLGPEGASAGCRNDLERVSELALRAVGSWGLDAAMGLVSLEGVRRGLGRAAGASTTLAVEDEAVERARLWLSGEHEASRRLVEGNRDRLEGLARELLERETLYQEDLAEYWARALSAAGGAGAPP